jgi:imidazolonepropionase-like amidohydrolase
MKFGAPKLPRTSGNVNQAFRTVATFFVKHVGFTPLQTIGCATKTGAEIMGCQDQFGTLEPGKLADVLVVEGDVLADIGLLEDRGRFLAVLQGGIVKAGQLARAERIAR